MKPKTDYLKLALNAGSARSREADVAARILDTASDTVVDIRSILPRPHASSRQVSPQHVLELAASISELGLIEPIAVDRSMRLLAGAHRLAALQILTVPVEKRRDSWFSMFPGSVPSQDFGVIATARELPASIPVHILELDSAADPATALLIEIAENEKRRNYSRVEVQGIAHRLQEAGYKISPGRPKIGEQALVPVLAATIGVSTRTIKRALAPQVQREVPEIVTPVLVSNKQEDRRLGEALNRWLGCNPHRQPARNLATELLTALGGSDVQGQAEHKNGSDDPDLSGSRSPLVACGDGG